MKAAVFIALTIFAGGFLLIWVTALMRGGYRKDAPTVVDCLIGLVTQFLDTLGVGSFATMSAAFKLWNLVPDEKIPGTLNVGSALTGILEAFIYIAAIAVDPLTLVLMVGASVAGAGLGAGVVSRWPRRKIQIGMSIALLVTAGLGLMRQLHFLPGGGSKLGLTGLALLLAVLANGLFGALMTVGIGLFAPCMMVSYLLGLSPLAVYPIMMGSTAFLGPVASVAFIRQSRYSVKSALGITLGGIPGVLVAAFVVRSIPLNAVRWLVIGAVLYTAVMMLRSAASERRQMRINRAAAGSVAVD